MQTILVASDLSDRSDAAIRRGVALAADLGARLILLHVVDAAMPAPLAEAMQAQSRDHLQAALDGALAGRDLAADIRVEIGDVTERITEIAQEARADLLIVGVHRRRALLDQFRETTMERLIRTARLPVLMVTGPAERPYGRMLGAVGFSRACASAIDKGCTIAPRADVGLFHAHEVSFRREAERDYATWKAVSQLPPGLPEPVFVEEAPVDAVRSLMDAEPYDLICIGTHTRSNLAQMLLGGFTAALIRRPPCDVLVAK